MVRSARGGLLDFVAHLVPKGSPLGLAPFIVLIESVSLVIRPFTLAIRILANMIAGHLILRLSLIHI